STATSCSTSTMWRRAFRSNSHLRGGARWPRSPLARTRAPRSGTGRAGTASWRWWSSATACAQRRSRPAARAAIPHRRTSATRRSDTRLGRCGRSISTSRSSRDTSRASTIRAGKRALARAEGSADAGGKGGGAGAGPNVVVRLRPRPLSSVPSTGSTGAWRTARVLRALFRQCAEDAEAERAVALDLERHLVDETVPRIVNHQAVGADLVGHPACGFALHREHFSVRELHGEFAARAVVVLAVERVG